MKTEVFVRQEQRFDMTGKALPVFLTLTDMKVSKRLAQRLHRYALSALKDAGFHEVVSGWSVEVHTSDGDSQVNDRFYCVRWVNSCGGYISVVGILISNGVPTLDHGLAIGDR
ncbi:hypothetical protein BFS14_02045 [Serratia fonticola]|uniref:hypothetical protein n=1 Tax=Serratia fonticola TaxID=47917 RepID=UPI0008FD5097|nr:hypothetical protein [Serratia fonticola]OIX96269.1 hypothetical protein BFS14_02045 [Serratia fonticola]QCR60809.1 hypothetical protein FD644_10725 [Serratia fonticola]